jgi:hypothetical protein
MTIPDILAVPTAPSKEELERDFWDDENCLSYSEDGTKLLDAENFPSEVTVKDGCRIICDEVFSFQDYMAENDHFYEPVPEEERVAYLDKIKLPESLTHIGKMAFLECGWLLGLRLPKNLLVIGDMAFKDCWQLQTLGMPGSLLSIGERAFEDCFSLYHVRLNKGLKRIGERAFNCCEELEEIFLPSGLEYMGKEVFRGCTSLERINIRKGAWAKFKSMIPHNLHKIVEES